MKASALLVGIAMLVASVTSWSRVATVEIKVMDALTGLTLPGAQVSIDGTRGSTFVVPKDAESQLVVDVEASAGATHYPRSLTYSLHAYRVTKLRLNIYLAPVRTGMTHNRRSVAFPAAMRNEEVDRAVALLEGIAAELNPSVLTTQTGFYLRYHLWSAYARHCTLRYSDYCAAAVNAGKVLLDPQTYSRDLFALEKVDAAAIANEEANLKELDLTLAYRRAQWELNRKSTDMDEESIEILESAMKDDPDLLIKKLKIEPAELVELRRQLDALEATPE